MELEHSNSINKALAKDLLNNHLDLSIDYSEILIDNIFDTGVLEEVPIVKTFVAVAKTSIAIREKFNLKKLLTFLKEFHKGDIETSKLEGFKTKFTEDKRYRDQVTEHIIIFIDRFSHISKAEILANLLKTHVEEKISWERFVELSICLDNLHPTLYKFLEELSNSEWRRRGNGHSTIQIEKEGLAFSSGIGFRHGSMFQISKLGQDLYEFGIKKLNNF